MFREVCEPVARSAGLRVSGRTLRRYVQRLTPGNRLFGQTCDGRGGPGRLKPRVSGPSGTRAYLEALLGRRTIASVKAAWCEADATARRLGWPRFSLRSAQRIARSLTAGVVRVGTYQRRRAARPQRGRR